MITGANRRCSSLGFTNERTAREGTHGRHLRECGCWQSHGAIQNSHGRKFDATFNVNVRGTLFIVQKALAFLRDHASIILNGAAGSGGRGFPTITVCAASKAALRSFARTWTSALQDRKIRERAEPGRDRHGSTTGAQEIYAEDGSLREAKMVTVPGINHLTWCAGRRLRNDGHSLPVL